MQRTFGRRLPQPRYRRYAWGDKGKPITEEEIKAIKKATADRKTLQIEAGLQEP